MKIYYWFYAGMLLLAVSCKPAYLLTVKDSLKPGDHFVYRQTQQTESVATLEESDQFTLNTEVTDFDYTVVAARPDGNVDLKMKILRVQQTEDQEGKHTDYDTDAPVTDSSDVKGQIYRHLIGQEFNLTMTSQGEIVQFSGMDALWDKVTASFSDIPYADVMLKGVKSQFSDETMGKQTGDLWSNLPPKAIRVGKKWKKPGFVPTFKLHREMVYRLDACDAQQARISFTSTVFNDAKAPGELDMGMIKIQFILKGSGSGVIILDQPLATVRTIEQNLEMGGDMEVKITGMAAQKVPMKMKMTSKMERIQ